MSFFIRPVSGQSDIEAICEIYGYYVEKSLCTWAYAPQELPKIEEYKSSWQACTSRGLPWLVAVAHGEADSNKDKVIGFITVREFRGREGWRNTCEHGVYLADGWQRKGVGRALLEAALEGCKAARVACLIAVVSVHPQSGAGEASRKLHLSLGFESAGYLKGVGVKGGLVLDCEFLAKYLVPIDP